MGARSRSEEYRGCAESEAVSSFVCDHRSQAQRRGLDVAEGPTGHEVTGSPISLGERESCDEGPAAASPISSSERGVAETPDEVHPSDGAERDAVERPSNSAEAEIELSPDQRSEAEQEIFLQRVKEAYNTDEALRNKNFRKKLTKENNLWWRPMQGREAALYIPKENASDPQALQRECLHFVHAHPFAGHVGMQRTEELVQRDLWWPGM